MIISLSSKPSQTAQLTALLKSSAFMRGGAQVSEEQSFALPKMRLPCLKPSFKRGTAHPFFDSWMLGEERLRGVEGEETRGEERKREVVENQDLYPRKETQKDNCKTSPTPSDFKIRARGMFCCPLSIILRLQSHEPKESNSHCP